MAWWREWSDPTKWAMGILSALLIVTIVRYLPESNDGSHTPQPKTLVRILESKTREQTLSKLLRALQPLEKSDNFDLESDLVTEDPIIAGMLADADILVAHLHAFRARGNLWDEDAQHRLFEVVGQIAALNPNTQFLLYSSGFDSETGPARARDRARDDGQLPQTLEPRLHTIALPVGPEMNPSDLQAWTAKLRELSSHKPR